MKVDRGKTPEKYRLTEALFIECVTTMLREKRCAVCLIDGQLVRSSLRAVEIGFGYWWSRAYKQAKSHFWHVPGGWVFVTFKTTPQKLASCLTGRNGIA